MGVIRGVKAGPSRARVTVWKEFPGAVMARMKVKLPALLGILGAEQPPRYVPVSRIRAAMKSTQFEEQAAARARRRVGVVDPQALPARVGQPGRDAHRLGSRSGRPHRRDSCRERSGEMSSQDVLVLAEIQRGTLADVTLELLAAARALTAAAGGEVVALVLSEKGAAYASQLGAADRIVLVDDPQLAAYAPAPYVAALAGGGRRRAAQGRADRGHFDRLGRGAAACPPGLNCPAGDRLQGGPGRRRRDCWSPRRSAAAR